ncbi:MAG: MarR family transcriptional regulator [Gemmatimonadales bacterium]|nr:MAG: MarR family transcriptional regulator [Gemmatimonadales bacterium]
MDPAVERFVERMGLEAERDGLPRIAGRILGFLITAEAPASLDSIAEALHVSRASVSTNCRLLAEVGGAERVSLPGDRKDYYELAPAFPERLIRATIVRMKAKVEVAEEALRNLPADQLRARARMTTWRDFHAFILEEVDGLATRWHKRVASDADADADRDADTGASVHASATQASP